MRRALLALFVAIGASAPVATAHAAPEEAPPEAAPAAREGFGKRAHFIFGIDNLFGFSSDRLGEGDRTRTNDYSGLAPGYFGPRIGLHGVLDSGVTLGANLGLTYLKLSRSGPNSESDGAATFITTLAPRIGYAGSIKPTFGYWVRGGPSLRLLFPEKGDNTNLIGAGFELLAVITPVEHFGITVGPTIDIGLTGSSGGESATYSTYGLSIGLLTDL